MQFLRRVLDGLNGVKVGGHATSGHHLQLRGTGAQHLPGSPGHLRNTIGQMAPAQAVHEVLFAGDAGVGVVGVAEIAMPGGLGKQGTG